MTETRPIDTEIDDLRAIAELLDKHEWRAQQRMLNWLWEKFFSGEMKRRATTKDNGAEIQGCGTDG